jgi:hypothetical protein
LIHTLLAYWRKLLAAWYTKIGLLVDAPNTGCLLL